MRLEDMNWMDVESYLRQDDRVLLVVGACEQHGYLSLLTDIRIPYALATAAAERTQVLVAPPLNFGISPNFTTYPGTISLRTSTFLSVLEDMVRGLYGYGFRRLVVVNGHGGNDPARGLLVELANALPGLTADWYSWWLAPGTTALAEGVGLRSYHAAWIEAFPFCRVTEMPAGVKQPVAAPRVLSAEATRTVAGDGVYGGPYSADETLMQQIFDSCVADIVQKLRFEP